MKKKWIRQKSEDDNVVAVVKNLLYYIGVSYTDTNLEDEFKYHEDYSSIKSISDTLNLYHIPNKTVKIEKEKLFTVKLPAIVSFKNDNRFYLVIELNENEVTYIDTKKGVKIVSTQSFLSNWTGLVLMSLKVEKSGEINYKNNVKKVQKERKRVSVIYVLLVLIIAITIFVTYNKFNLYIVFIGAIKLFGLIASLILYNLKTGVNDALASKFCISNRYFDCNLNFSSYFKGFFSNDSLLAGIGVIYFSSSIVVLNVLSIFNFSEFFITIQHYISMGTASIAFLLLLIQTFFFKKFCPICSFVHIILISEIIISAYHSKIAIDFQLDFLMLFSLITIINILFFCILHSRNETIKEKEQYEKRFKHLVSKPNVLKTLLYNQETIQYNSFDHEIIIGDEKSSTEILLILSPFCKYCSEIFTESQRIFELVENIKIRIRLICKNNPKNEDFKIVSLILNALVSNGSDYAYKLINDWYSIKDTSKRNKLNWIKNHTIEFDSSNNIALLNEHLEFSREIGLYRTPYVLYNGYKLTELVDFKQFRNFVILN